MSTATRTFVDNQGRQRTIEVSYYGTSQAMIITNRLDSDPSRGQGFVIERPGAVALLAALAEVAEHPELDVDETTGGWGAVNTIAHYMQIPAELLDDCLPRVEDLHLVFGRRRRFGRVRRWVEDAWDRYRL